MFVRFIIFLFFITTFSEVIASNDVFNPKKVDWSFDGIFGTFDKSSAQRGYQVFQQVCSNCHDLKRLSFRNMLSLGFTKNEIEYLASSYQIQDGPNENGEMFTRRSVISDYIPSPYKNEQLARASNNGALPPDLSLITKSRYDGPNYVYSILTGYDNVKPNDLKIEDNLYYNPYFIGKKIAMANPLSEGIVNYQNNIKPTVEQMAKDVTQFLHWVSEPEMEVRKMIGIKVVLFLIFTTFVMYFTMRRIWSRV